MKWASGKLSQVAELVRGVSFEVTEVADTPDPDRVPVLRAGNISDRLNTESDLVWIPRQRVDDEQLLRAGDIAIAMSSGSPAIVGKTARLEREWFGAVGAFCAVIRPKKLVDGRYLAFWLRSSEFIAWRLANCMGVNIKNLRRSELENARLPLPPLSEQRRIVEILEQADALRRKRAAADAQAARILPSLFHHIFGDPASNPKGFRKEPLGNLIKVKSGDALSAKDMDSNGMYPVYGGNGINGYHSTYMVEDRMVVIGRVGAYCGVVHYSQPQSWVTDNALYVSEMSADLKPRYLVAALKTANLNQYAGRAGQPLVSGGRIYPVEILVPPEPKQKVWSSAAETLERLDLERKTSATKLDQLFATLLHRAFSGELTARWREAHLTELLAEMEQQAKALEADDRERD